ncbi:DUF1003 domain-containing protein [Longimicrobium sp.]|uniref:DUF1003 domain-containing protein n=1 Tax=Longimicrobium sp. TaxID=2029185 RepID=UPI002E33F156|nr:DUF1003 domain-containing protein [Longimicrobium sp.]HEX6037878.1 DUF1003 domain-containing protein [Longimicrobium sp.]
MEDRRSHDLTYVAHGRRGMGGVVDRNVRALLARRAAEDRAKSRSERIADGVTRFAGSMTFVYIHLVMYGAWIALNLGVVPGIRPWDPTFVILAMEASVEAIFLSTFVLISQNRMAALADKRADLDLQVSLLSEHEITRLLSLVQQMAEQMGIEEARDPELEELARDVHPERVLEKIEHNAQAFAENGGRPPFRDRRSYEDEAPGA